MANGWDSSAEAWIADMGEHGDYSREWVLDEPILERVKASAPGAVLDLGCGEGRFCRMLGAAGVPVTGLEPTERLRAQAMAMDTTGHYVAGRAEQLPFPDASFDMVVSYLSLIDIEDLDLAYSEICRVLRPGGRLLVANLSSFLTALPKGWERPWLPDDDGRAYAVACDDYHEERDYWVSWRGIRVRNFHRPLERYMAPLMKAGLSLEYFAEPAPHGGPKDKAALFARAPMFVVMEWKMPG